MYFPSSSFPLFTQQSCNDFTTLVAYSGIAICDPQRGGVFLYYRTSDRLLIFVFALLYFFFFFLLFLTLPFVSSFPKRPLGNGLLRKGWILFRFNAGHGFGGSHTYIVFPFNTRAWAGPGLAVLVCTARSKKEVGGGAIGQWCFLSVGGSMYG